MITRAILVLVGVLGISLLPATGGAQDDDVLRLALVVPVTSPPLYTPDGERTPDATQRVRTLADALDRLLVPELAEIPFALAPSPVLCDELDLLRYSPGDRPETRRVFQTISALSRATRLLVRPYADVRLSDLPSARAAAQELETAPRSAVCANRDREVVVPPALALDDEAVDGAARAGASVVLASSTDVTRGPSATRDVTLVPAITVLREETPNDAYGRMQGLDRGVALLPLDRADIATFIRALANDPRVKLVRMADIAREPVARRVRFDELDAPPPSYERALDGATEAFARIRAFTRPTDRFTALVRTLLARAASSAEWNGEWVIGRDRARAVERVVRQQERRISSSPGSVTFTSQRGSVPVTVRNGTPFPIRVRVELGSSKLEFPSGSSRVVQVEPPGDTVVFAALARSTGTFPVRVRLTSPDGSVHFAAAQLTVRSTATNLSAVTLTVGAAVFFVVWLVRRLRRRRRQRVGHA